MTIQHAGNHYEYILSEVRKAYDAVKAGDYQITPTGIIGKQLQYVPVETVEELFSYYANRFNRSAVLKLSGEALLFIDKLSNRSDVPLRFPSREEKEVLNRFHEFQFYIGLEEGLVCQCGRHLSGFDVMIASLVLHGDEFLNYIRAWYMSNYLIHVKSNDDIPCFDCYRMVRFSVAHLCNPYKYVGVPD